MTFKPTPGPLAIRGRYCTDDVEGTAWVEVFVSSDEPAIGCLPNADNLAPWASAEEWEAIGRLNEAVRDLLTNRGTRFTVQNVLRERYHELAPLRDRLGW